MSWDLDMAEWDGMVMSVYDWSALGFLFHFFGKVEALWCRGWKLRIMIPLSYFFLVLTLVELSYH
jgi:hypothetical protein